MVKWRLTFVLMVLQEILMASVSCEEMLVMPRSTNLAEMTVNVIKLCYGGRVNAISLGGNVSDSFIASISLDNPIIAILLRGGENPEGQAEVSEKYRIALFAFTVSAHTELEEILVFVKNSKWWDHMAQFYAFDSPAGDIGCGEAFGFLWTAWRMNILGAKFICHDETEGPLIYAFNPFGLKAPAPWKVERTRSNINNHSWTLLVRQFHSNVNICETMGFDQTRDTSGFELFDWRCYGSTKLNLPSLDNSQNSSLATKF